MLKFGSGASSAPRGAIAAEEALEVARRELEGETPRLAIVFASVTYEDVDGVTATLRHHLGPDVPVVGGTAGAGVFGPVQTVARGVSVVLLGGDLRVAVESTAAASPDLVEVVPTAERVASAADRAAKEGFTHFTCLVFAPGLRVDGEALVAAVRKGAGARAQLAGGLTGDEFTMDRTRVIEGDAWSDRAVVLAGVFTRGAVGIAARHGWRTVGPRRVVTRADGVFLFELDGRPALEIWLEDARGAGATIPDGTPREVALYLLRHYELGISDPSAKPGPNGPEVVARAPYLIRADNAVHMSASIAEGAHVCLIHASQEALLGATRDAARAAVARTDGTVAGALVFACSGRMAALGTAVADEPGIIREEVGAKVGGGCVFGEIARNVRDRDAFFNTTTVVVVFSE